MNEFNCEKWLRQMAANRTNEKKVKHFLACAERIKELEAIIEEAEHHLLNIPMNLDDLDGIDKAIVTLNRGRDDAE